MMSARNNGTNVSINVSACAVPLEPLPEGEDSLPEEEEEEGGGGEEGEEGGAEEEEKEDSLPEDEESLQREPLPDDLVIAKVLFAVPSLPPGTPFRRAISRALSLPSSTRLSS
jgi:hypothetical protein